MYTGSITEGSLPSVVVMIVSYDNHYINSGSVTVIQSPAIMAMDRDEMNTQNSQITYSLLNGDQGTGAEYFIIDPATATIEVSLEGHNNLDYETVQHFNLTVCVYSSVIANLINFLYYYVVTSRRWRRYAS